MNTLRQDKFQVSQWEANQVTIEGLTKEEIEGALEYSEKCLKQAKKIGSTWEAKEYQSNINHYKKLLEQLTYNYNLLIEDGVQVCY